MTAEAAAVVVVVVVVVFAVVAVVANLYFVITKLNKRRFCTPGENCPSLQRLLGRCAGRMKITYGAASPL